jgi:glutathione S-transferase
VKLYTIRASRYGARCLIQIAAKGLPVEVEILPYPIPESYSEVNPFRMVPALDIGGSVLIETNVICEYLEDLHQGRALRPADALDLARMRLLTRLFESYYDAGMLEMYKLLDKSAPRIQANVDRSYDSIDKSLKLMKLHMDGPHYAIGQTLTLADCALVPPLHQSRIMLDALGYPDPLAGHPEIMAYYENTAQDEFIAPVLRDMEDYLAGWLADWRKL